MKRFLFLFFFIFIFIIVGLINLTCLFLDNILFPAWRKTVIKAPVFIIGMPRTASSRLQCILCEDSNYFSSMKLWEILFAPSVLQKKVFITLRRLDKHLHNFFSVPIRKLDKLVFNKFKPMHPTSFFCYEEDDLLLFPIFSTILLIFILPRMNSLRSLIHFDEWGNERRKQRIISFYKKCIQRHLYVFGSGKTYLSKSPDHTPKILSLCKAFPDSRYICNVRAPEQVIPSAVSLFIRFYEISKAYYKIDTLLARTFAVADYWYPHPLDAFRKLAENRYIILPYEQITHNIGKAVASIYSRFRIQLSAEYKDFLMQEQLKPYRSAHVYSAEKYSLNSGEIRARYNNIYQEYLKKLNNSDQEAKR